MNKLEDLVYSTQYIIPNPSSRLYGLVLEEIDSLKMVSVRRHLKLGALKNETSSKFFDQVTA